jgi:DNA-binding transcriptional regulator YdaS (Cro superfamily)
MDFLAYWKKQDATGRDRLADAVGAAKEYLSQVAYGHRRASPALALRIEEVTVKAVSRHDLRPDIYPVAGADAETATPSVEPARPAAPPVKIPLRAGEVLRRGDAEDGELLGLTVRSAGPRSPVPPVAGGKGER